MKIDQGIQKLNGGGGGVVQQKTTKKGELKTQLLILLKIKIKK
jgi:hypothetical protein